MLLIASEVEEMALSQNDLIHLWSMKLYLRGDDHNNAALAPCAWRSIERCQKLEETHSTPTQNDLPPHTYLHDPTSIAGGADFQWENVVLKCAASDSTKSMLRLRSFQRRY